MLDLLVAVLVTALVLLAVAVAWTFAGGSGPTPGHTAATETAALYRVVLAALCVAVGALAVSVVLRFGPVTTAASIVGLGLSVLIWLPLGRVWASRGVLVWALTVDVGAAALTVAAAWLLTADLAAPALVVGFGLWIFETAVVVVGLGRVGRLVDARVRRVPAERADRRTAAWPSGVWLLLLGPWSERTRWIGPVVGAAGVLAAVTILALPLAAPNPAADRRDPGAAFPATSTDPTADPTEGAGSPDRTDGTDAPTQPASSPTGPTATQSNQPTGPTATDPTSDPTTAPTSEPTDDHPHGPPSDHPHGPPTPPGHG